MLRQIRLFLRPMRKEDLYHEYYLRNSAELDEDEFGSGTGESRLGGEGWPHR